MKLGDARVFSVPTFSSDSAPRASTAVDRWALAASGHRCPRPACGSCSGTDSKLPYAGDAPVGTIVFKNRRALFSWVWDPDSEFRRGLHVRRRRDPRRSGGDARGDLSRAAAARRRARWWLWQRSNDERAARENVHRHYDLGNEFYRLWLDREMVYTCAYFPTPDATLEEAQIAKMDRVCRKLQLKPGERVVEAGCGWGSLALFMARHYGVTVRAFNISAEQIAYARERAQRAKGSRDRVEFVEDDYRNVAGTYDAFVSVGMLEHVGPGGLPDARRASSTRSLTERGPRPAALHRPQPAGAAQPVDPQADFPGRVPADAAAKCSSACSSRRTSRCSTSRTSGCTTRRRSSTGARRFETRGRRGGARCSTRRSSAPGGCTSRARRRRSPPARCSCSRWCSRAAPATRSRGRVVLSRAGECHGPAGPWIRRATC